MYAAYCSGYSGKTGKGCPGTSCTKVNILCRAGSRTYMSGEFSKAMSPGNVILSSACPEPVEGSKDCRRIEGSGGLEIQFIEQQLWKHTQQDHQGGQQHNNNPEAAAHGSHLRITLLEIHGLDNPEIVVYAYGSAQHGKNDQP